MAWLDKRVSGYYLRDRLPNDPSFSIPLGKITPRTAAKAMRDYEIEKGARGVAEGELGRLMSEVFAEYKNHLIREKYSPKTVNQLPFNILPLVRDVMRVKQLTPKVIQAHRDWLYAFKRPNGKPYSVDTVAHRLRAISAFCSWMEAEKILSPSPFAVKVPEGRKDAGRALTGPQVLALFKAWPAPRLYNKRRTKHDLSKLFFRIVFFGGTRMTEVLGDTLHPEEYPGLQHEDVNRSRLTIKLAKTKAQEAREVALPAEIMETIPRGSGPVFRGHIEAAALREHLAQAMAAAQITGKFRIHDGRVTAATEWLRQNPDLKTTMDQFGWKSEKMALHYNKVATERRIAQAQKITYSG